MLEIMGASGQIRIELQHVELEQRPDYGTMEWHVQVRTDDLTGKQDKVSIWPIHYERFLDELVTLERVR